MILKPKTVGIQLSPRGVGASDGCLWEAVCPVICMRQRVVAVTLQCTLQVTTGNEKPECPQVSNRASPLVRRCGFRRQRTMGPKARYPVKKKQSVRKITSEDRIPFSHPKGKGGGATFLSIHPRVISKLAVPSTWITVLFRGVRGSRRCPAVS